MTVENRGQMVIDGFGRRLPLIYPSISTVKADHDPVSLLKFLHAVGAPRFLVSAYDLARGTQSSALRRALIACMRQHKPTVILDSGGYEAEWLRDLSWSRKQMRSVEKSATYSVAMSFDYHSKARTVQLHRVLQGFVSDRKALSPRIVALVVRGFSDSIVKRVKQCARSLSPAMVAVTERDLGFGIVERASRVAELRKALDVASPQTVLHILGAGDPLSVAVYYACGAASFDGLDWCQQAFNVDRLSVEPTSHVVLWKNNLAPASCTDPIERVLTHNLRALAQIEVLLSERHTRRDVVDGIRDLWGTDASRAYQLVLRKI